MKFKVNPTKDYDQCILYVENEYKEEKWTLVAICANNLVAREVATKYIKELSKTYYDEFEL